MLKHCTLLTVEDVQKDEASIMAVLSAIWEQKLPNDLSLLNYYRELPVSFAASIESIDRGVVQMKVHEMQIASMLMQKATLIKSGHLPYGVIANVLRLRKADCISYLTQFSYVRIHADQRLYVRVKVAGKFDAAFYNDNHLVRGRIEDISFSGVAIKAPKGSSLEENVKGTVSIWLPGATLEVPAKLLKIQGDEVFIFELEIDEKSEMVLSQFIFQQQSQIIRELREIGS
ncbi:MAG TPA: PilZ domain-containing protein [Geobacteraceae bacterium]|nr:PilZ domain-containing protein [Geobacteraceae bacterium]